MELKEFYKIENKTGDCTSFHLIGRYITPGKNFERALKWYVNDMLTVSCFRELETILSDSKISKKYGRLLNDSTT